MTKHYLMSCCSRTITETEQSSVYKFNFLTGKDWKNMHMGEVIFSNTFSMLSNDPLLYNLYLFLNLSKFCLFLFNFVVISSYVLLRLSTSCLCLFSALLLHTAVFHLLSIPSNLSLCFPLTLCQFVCFLPHVSPLSLVSPVFLWLVTVLGSPLCSCLVLWGFWLVLSFIITYLYYFCILLCLPFSHQFLGARNFTLLDLGFWTSAHYVLSTWLPLCVLCWGQSWFLCYCNNILGSSVNIFS